MPSTNANVKRRSNRPTASASRSTSEEVLTLAEAAAYLRVPEMEVLRMVHEQGLPGRQLGADWRFLKAGVREWLQTPLRKPSKEAVLAAIGSWKGDPYFERLLQEINKQENWAGK